MRRAFLVFEDLRTTPRRRLFTLFGVEWLATPYAWLSLPFFCALGVATAMVGGLGPSPGSRVWVGVVYGLLLYACNSLHSLGHLLGGTLLGAPMNALLLTATRDVTVYLGSRAEVPMRIRVARSASGPLLNVLVGALAIVFGGALQTRWLTVFGYFNLGVGIWTLAPIPTMDGWVVWTGMLGRGR